MNRKIRESEEIYCINEWGEGYFYIDDDGNVSVKPDNYYQKGVCLKDIVNFCKKKEINTPIIIRFPQIIDTQVNRLHAAFKNAIDEYDYDKKHYGVFPLKVNQRYEFIDSIVKSGYNLNYGLEIGSKAELLAAIKYTLPKKSLLICNGFKDKQFIELSFIASAMNYNIHIVIEDPKEIEIICKNYKMHAKFPNIGLRIKLYSKGSGKWENSSGENSKFGLTTSEVLICLDILNKYKLSKYLNMLHFHIGSQITEIKRFKNAINEAARVYAKIVKMGFSPKFLNLGGGIGVDYDGSKTSFQSSANYSMQQFARDAVYVIAQVCDNENVEIPNLVTESGRIIAAYHSVLITDIMETRGIDDISFSEKELFYLKSNKLPKGIQELKYILDNIKLKNFSEYYHDATQYYEEIFLLFNLGYIGLKDRAISEKLYHKICSKALYYLSFQKKRNDEFDYLKKMMAHKYLANFSIFQSILDSWAIDQLFPVMPISGHLEKTSRNATIVDITCDSDGCLDKFIDKKSIKSMINLHNPKKLPYYIGFFLVGAYQESLATEHNLFGAINEISVVLKSNGDWSISKISKGDSIIKLLENRNFKKKDIISSYHKAIEKSINLKIIDEKYAKYAINKLKKALETTSYLEMEY